jgi:hypothetical protein
MIVVDLMRIADRTSVLKTSKKNLPMNPAQEFSRTLAVRGRVKTHLNIVRTTGYIDFNNLIKLSLGWL